MSAIKIYTAVICILFLASCAQNSGPVAPIVFQSGQTSDSILPNGPVKADDDTDLAAQLDQAEQNATAEGRRILQMGRSMIANRVIVLDSCWDYVNAIYTRAGFTGRNITTPFEAKETGPFADTSTIQPGDWLYFINHSYGDVEHSGIFLLWTDPTQKEALILSYPGGDRLTPARYSTYELTNVYNIMRPKAGLAATLPPLPSPTPLPFQLAVPTIDSSEADSAPNPVGVAIDKTGAIFVVDDGTSEIEKFDSSGHMLAHFGAEGAANGPLSQPSGIAIDAQGNLLVADAGNNRIEKFDANGNVLSLFGTAGTGNGQFAGLSGIAVDSKGMIYVVDIGNNRVQKFDAQGNFISVIGSAGAGNGQFSGPMGIAVDAQGDLLVVDAGNSRIQKFDASGTYVSAFGASGSAKGQFSSPSGIAIDAQGNLLVSDDGRVQKFDATGKFISEVGPSTSHGVRTDDLPQPQGLAVDTAGNLYVGDQVKERVQKFNANGILQSL